uniref:Si:ch211-253b8.5 n=1 Tax=Neogobius melanostomus TaxID=47308 RepID=A0A8C6U4K7_9GOBI
MVTDRDAAQQHKIRERQRFFEEVFQHDVDVYLSSAHLSIRDSPIGSISSMEVNVDLLDQMELIDISDQDALDVFFSSSEESVLASPLPGMDFTRCRTLHKSCLTLTNHCVTLQGRVTITTKRSSALGSSVSSGDSQNMNATEGHTPVEGSDDEEQGNSGTLKRRSKPAENRAS